MATEMNVPIGDVQATLQVINPIEERIKATPPEQRISYGGKGNTKTEDADIMTELRIKSSSNARIWAYIPRLGTHYSVALSFVKDAMDTLRMEFEEWSTSMTHSLALLLWGDKCVQPKDPTKKTNQPVVVHFASTQFKCIALSTLHTTLFLDLNVDAGTVDRMILLDPSSDRQNINSDPRALVTNLLMKGKKGSQDVATYSPSIGLKKSFAALAEYLKKLKKPNDVNDLGSFPENIYKRYLFYFTKGIPDMSAQLQDLIYKDIKCDVKHMLAMVAHALLQKHSNEPDTSAEATGIFRDALQEYSKFYPDVVPPLDLSWDDPAVALSNQKQTVPLLQAVAGRRLRRNRQDAPYTGRQVRLNYRYTDYRFARMRLYRSELNRWLVVESVDFSANPARITVTNQKGSPEVVHLSANEVHFFRHSPFATLGKGSSFVVHRAKAISYLYFRCDDLSDMNLLVEIFFDWLARYKMAPKRLERAPGTGEEFNGKLEQLGALLHGYNRDRDFWFWPVYGVVASQTRICGTQGDLTALWIQQDQQNMIRRMLDKLAIHLADTMTDCQKKSVSKQQWSANYKLYDDLRTKWGDWYPSKLPYLTQPDVSGGIFGIPYNVVNAPFDAPDTLVKAQQTHLAGTEMLYLY